MSRDPAEPFPLAPALWAATAPPAPDTPPLAAPAQADVCIVGGGYCGLSAALHLAEAGAQVVLLEAREPGWGASGRNGGQVIPGLKFDPDEVLGLFPGEAGERLIAFGAATADAVFDLILKHRMDVPWQRAGWIQGAHDEARRALVAKRASQWAKRGVGVQILDRKAVRNLLGTGRYAGGWLDPRGGAVQPLSYARGLARAALAAGATIHGDTAATGLDRADGNWRIGTVTGHSVIADRVLVCTNAYTGDLLPGLRQSIVPLNSYQIATAPLPETLRGVAIPYGHVCSDTRKLLLYFRQDHTGRLVLGGRGPLREPMGAEDWAHLERVVGKLFPPLAGVPIEYRWCGRVALTRDHLPHLHEPAPGLLVDIGCMGRGIGLQTAMGMALARYLGSGDVRDLPLPPAPVRPIPLHALRQLWLAGVVAWYRLSDAGL